jgi:hypothetical protein
MPDTLASRPGLPGEGRGVVPPGDGSMSGRGEERA